MKIGIIIEINERFLTMLTPDGEFVKARKDNRPYSLGEEISFSLFEEERKTWSILSYLQTFKGRTVSVAALALLLAVSTFFPVYESNKVYAYMSIDINPSIEMGINEKLQVVELIPYNNEGKKIIEEIEDWKKEDLDKITSNILMEIDEQGYAHNNQEIIIAKVYTGGREENIDRKLDKEIDVIKQEVKEENIEVNVVEATKKEREKAKKQGITTGKLIERQNVENIKTSTVKPKASNSSKEEPKKESKVHHSVTKSNQKKLEKETKDKKQLSQKSLSNKEAIKPITKKNSPKNNQGNKKKVKIKKSQVKQEFNKKKDNQNEEKRSNNKKKASKNEKNHQSANPYKDKQHESKKSKKN